MATILVTKVYKTEGDSHAKMLTLDPETRNNGAWLPLSCHAFLTGSQSPFLPTPNNDIRWYQITLGSWVKLGQEGNRKCLQLNCEGERCLRPDCSKVHLMAVYTDNVTSLT